MLITQLKSRETIEALASGKVFIINCHGCKEVSFPEKEAAEHGIVRLPHTLGEAIEAFEGSALMRETLGDHIYDYLLNAKRAEVESYCRAVTDWEREHYYGGV